jgi:hypothetical protein
MNYRFFLMALLPMPAMSQSVELFRGGAGDGTGRNTLSQQSVSFWLGGQGDGIARSGYVQSTANLWRGGDGDGVTTGKYVQSSVSVWTGGHADGWASTNYQQASISFWKGGAGDGFADSNYAQSSNAFWLGGRGDGWASTYIPTRPLPVSFGEFRATRHANLQSLLQWNTLSEANTSHFEIERGTDAVHFSNIGKVKAAGNNNASRKYSFIDPKARAGANYYRLKQVDQDGKWEYTPTRMVVFETGSSQNLKVYPNPARNFLMLDLPESALHQRIAINLMDIKGNVVAHWKMESGALSQQRIEWNYLPAGSYLIHISGQETSLYQKVIIR